MNDSSQSPRCLRHVVVARRGRRELAPPGVPRSVLASRLTLVPLIVLLACGGSATAPSEWTAASLSVPAALAELDMLGRTAEETRVPNPSLALALVRSAKAVVATTTAIGRGVIRIGERTDTLYAVAYRVVLSKAACAALGNAGTKPQCFNRLHVLLWKSEGERAVMWLTVPAGVAPVVMTASSASEATIERIGFGSMTSDVGIGGRLGGAWSSRSGSCAMASLSPIVNAAGSCVFRVVSVSGNGILGTAGVGTGTTSFSVQVVTIPGVEVTVDTI